MASRTTRRSGAGRGTRSSAGLVQRGVERGPGTGWRRKRGRPGAGDLDEKRAIVAMAEVIRQHAEDEATRAEQRRHAAARSKTFRSLAHRWLDHVERVKQAKPSTLQSYRTLLSEPGQPYRRGRGTTSGRMMAAFGDRPRVFDNDRGHRALPRLARRRARSADGQLAPPDARRDIQLRRDSSLRPHTQPRSGGAQAPRAPSAAARNLHRRGDRSARTRSRCGRRPSGRRTRRRAAPHRRPGRRAVSDRSIHRTASRRAGRPALARHRLVGSRTHRRARPLGRP